MLSFFKSALAELSQVSWPTSADMRRYMIATGIIIAFGVVYIAVTGGIFTEAFWALRDAFSVTSPSSSSLLTPTSGEVILPAAGN